MFRKLCVWCLIVLSAQSAICKVSWKATNASTATTPPSAPIPPLSKLQLELVMKSIRGDLNNIAKMVNDNAVHWLKDEKEYIFQQRVCRSLDEMKKKYEKYQDIASKFYPGSLATNENFHETIDECKAKLNAKRATFCVHCKRSL